VNELVRSPNADLDQVFGFIWDEVKIDIFSRLNARDLEGMSSERDTAIAIGGAAVA